MINSDVVDKLRLDSRVFNLIDRIVFLRYEGNIIKLKVKSIIYRKKLNKKEILLQCVRFPVYDEEFILNLEEYNKRWTDVYHNVNELLMYNQGDLFNFVEE